MSSAPIEPVLGVVVDAPQTRPAPTTTAQAQCTLTVQNEFPSIQAKSSTVQELTTMLHVAAPVLNSLEERRQGVRTSAVIDVSGSMRGGKLDLVKRSLSFMISQLTEKDTFGIITFATNVQERLPLTKMNAEGKAVGLRIVESLKDQDCTNLSGGLFAGIDQVCGNPFRASAPASRPPPPSAVGRLQKKHSRKAAEPNSVIGKVINFFSPPVATAPPEETEAAAAVPVETAIKGEPCSVLLFTDGMANNGITKSAELTQALKGRLESCPHVVVHTFGFGSDHDAPMLQSIAEQSQGSYYFIKDESVMKECFADCLGGLVSVVCTNIQIQCVVQAKYSQVSKVLTKFPQRTFGNIVTVEMKDLYSGEVRDVPVTLKINTADLASGQSLQVCDWVAQYCSTIDQQQHEQRVPSIVDVCDAPFTGAPNVAVEEQRNRFLTAESIEEARQAAERHDFENARMRVREAQQRIHASCAKETTFSKALCEELDDVMDRCEDETQYAKKGGAQFFSAAVSRHCQQRCNSSTESALYETSWKGAMKKKSKFA